MGSLSVWLCFTRRYPMLMLRPGMPGRPGLPGRPGSPGRDREAALHLPRGPQPACLQRARRHSRPQGWGQWLCPWGLRASWGGLTLAQYPLPVQDRVMAIMKTGWRGGVWVWGAGAWTQRPHEPTPFRVGTAASLIVQGPRGTAVQPCPPPPHQAAGLPAGPSGSGHSQG